MFIASLCINRGEVKGKQFRRFGSIWENEGRISLKLSAIVQGKFMALPFDTVSHPPLIEGDLNVWTGEFKEEGKKRYQWIGHIHTDESDDGTGKVRYYGAIELLPIRFLQEKDLGTTGMWVTVFLNDDERNVASVPTAPITDNSPAADELPMGDFVDPRELVGTGKSMWSDSSAGSGGELPF